MKLTNKQKKAIRKELLFYCESLLMAKEDEYSGYPDILRSLNNRDIMKYCEKVLRC